MIFNYKIFNFTFLITFFFLLVNCQLQKSSNNHGILFLENRYKKLEVKKTNMNDVVKILGNPHTKSIKNIDQWIYIERILSKGKFHKLGQNIVKTNNVVILTFNKYGILEEKNFYNKDKIAKIKFTKDVTINNLSQKSFVEEFLQSIKTKMYGGK